MTEQEKQHAASVLLGTHQLLGGEDQRYLPKIFVVDGKCYMFLNAARRAAYRTPYAIEVMTIEDAWRICKGQRETLDTKAVEWDFDQSGTTFCGMLFCDSDVDAITIPNPVVKMKDRKPDLAAMLDMDINLTLLTTRARNILAKTNCKTYRDLLKITRMSISRMKNVGAATIGELDAEMDRVGLWSNWKYDKPIR